MFGSTILEVVIGVVFIYMLLSLLATTVNELIMTLLSSARGRVLERAIMAMLDDAIPSAEINPKKGDAGNVPGTKLAKDFYQHPMIVKLSEQGKDDKPSYISKVYFSTIVIDLLSAKDKVEIAFADIVEVINKLPEGKTKELLLSFVKDITRQVKDTEDQIEAFKTKLEHWYDEMMDRASGWYKRKVQRMLLIIGFVMSIVFNADTFNIVNHLFNNPEDRAGLVTQAEHYRDMVAQNLGSKLAEQDTTSAADSSQASTKCDSLCKFTSALKVGAPSLMHLARTPEDSVAIEKVDSLNKVINGLVNEQLTEASTTAGMGWNLPALKESTWDLDHFLYSLLQWLLYILPRIPGWCVTALAITLGAPFWFDMLNKVTNIRNVGKKPEEKPKTDSQ
ncbi:MAG: hypothetical protein V4714_11295 [Bacteroidota bacterium]